MNGMLVRRGGVALRGRVGGNVGGSVGGRVGGSDYRCHSGVAGDDEGEMRRRGSGNASRSVAPGKETRIRWSLAAQREFLERLERKHRITEMEHWQRVTVPDVVKEGGSGLLRHYKSFFDALSTVLADREKEWGAWSEARARKVVRKGYFESRERRREFLDAVKSRHSIHGSEGWQKITVGLIRATRGGRRLLDLYPCDTESGQLLHLLRDTYPEEEWDSRSCRGRLPRHHWSDLENIREAVRRVEPILGVKQPADWYRISLEQLVEAMGTSTLAKRFRFADLIKAVYPDVKWDEERLAERRGKRATQAQLLRVVTDIFQ